MRTRGVTGLTGRMTTRSDRSSPVPRTPKHERIGWFALAMVLLGVGVVFLPWIVMVVLVALFGLGGTGSNK